MFIMQVLASQLCFLANETTELGFSRDLPWQQNERLFYISKQHKVSEYQLVLVCMVKYARRDSERPRTNNDVAV